MIDTRVRRIASRRLHAASVCAVLAAAFMLGFAASPVGAADRGAPVAVPGTRLVEALEAGTLVVVGSVEAANALDSQGHAATLAVETVLVGAHDAPQLHFVWEELSPSRAPRFGRGDRILLVLDPLPGASLWRARIPEPEFRQRTWIVSQKGQAFLSSPSSASLHLLEHYLALPRAERRGPAGTLHLASLVADAPHALAVSAARRLDLARPPILAEAGPLLVRGLLRDDERLETILLEWIANKRPGALRNSLEATIQGLENPPIVLYTALGRLDGKLAEARFSELSESGGDEARAEAARFAPAGEHARLARWARADRSPAVRSAALDRLLALKGESALDVGLDAFGDEILAVRMQAALGVARLGSGVVERVSDVALRWAEPAPATAVFALQQIGGGEARAALEEIAGSHPDRGIRDIALIALGRPVGDTH